MKFRDYSSSGTRRYLNAPGERGKQDILPSTLLLPHPISHFVAQNSHVLCWMGIFLFLHSYKVAFYSQWEPLRQALVYITIQARNRHQGDITPNCSLSLSLSLSASGCLYTHANHSGLDVVYLWKTFLIFYLKLRFTAFSLISLKFVLIWLEYLWTKICYKFNIII